MSDRHYDVFISYRRKGGDATARLFYESLTKLGYRVSFDMETLRSGKFNVQLYRRIEECQDVVVLLSEGALELRANREDDWFRLEVAHAIECGKNIVPVFLRDFRKPEHPLPDDVAELMDHEGVTASDEHYDSTLARICRLLRAKPHVRRIRMAIGIACCALLAAAGWAVYERRADVFPYPHGKAEKASWNAISANLTMQCTYMDELFGWQANLLESARQSVATGSKSAFDDMAGRYRSARDRMSIDMLAPSEALMAGVRIAPVDPTEFALFYDILKTYFSEVGEEALVVGDQLDKMSAVGKSDVLRTIDIKRRHGELYARMYCYSVMSLLREVPERALLEFKEKACVRWSSLDELNRPWIRDESDLSRACEGVSSALEKNLAELGTVVASQSAAMAEDAEKFLANLKEMGADDARAMAMLEKVQKVAGLQTELRDAQNRIDVKYAQLRDKCRVQPEDEPSLAYGKTLRLMTVAATLQEGARFDSDILANLEALKRRKSDDFPAAVCDAVAAYAVARTSLGLAGGQVVTAFEGGRPHAVLKVGDVIAAVNGRPCVRYADFTSKAGTAYDVYRLEGGSLRRHALTMPEGQPRVAVIGLTEED